MQRLSTGPTIGIRSTRMHVYMHHVFILSSINTNLMCARGAAIPLYYIINRIVDTYLFFFYLPPIWYLLLFLSSTFFLLAARQWWICMYAQARQVKSERWIRAIRTAWRKTNACCCFRRVACYCLASRMPGKLVYTAWGRLTTHILACIIEWCDDGGWCIGSKRDEEHARDAP